MKVYSKKSKAKLKVIKRTDAEGSLTFEDVTNNTLAVVISTPDKEPIKIEVIYYLLPTKVLELLYVY